MKFSSLLFVALLLSATAGAQAWVNDSVTMGPGYANDIWYSMENGGTPPATNKNWTLAFQTTVQGPYGNVSVWANHAQDTVSVWSLHKEAAGNFGLLSLVDTAGKTRLFNSPTSWNYGAFNRNADTANQFDYGWGFYDQLDNHNVNGDSLYLMQAGTSLFQVWIEQYKTLPTDSSTWKFRIARLDGSEDTTIYINRAFFANKNFAYYEARNRVVLDREPASNTWDIVFTRYTDSLDLGGGIGSNTTTGPLLNHGVTAARVLAVNPDTVSYAPYPYSNALNAIGWDWKTAPMGPGAWTVDSNRTYFIKTVSGDYYQLVFTSFTGSANSKTVFKKRKVAAAAVRNINSAVSRFLVSPIPAGNEVSVMLDAAKALPGARLTLTDVAGSTVFAGSVSVGRGMNAYSINTAQLPAGTYVLSVRGDGIALSRKVVVAH